MARKKHSAEQIVAILRQIEVELANHKSIGQACKEAGITQQTYYRPESCNTSVVMAVVCKYSVRPRRHGPKANSPPHFR